MTDLGNASGILKPLLLHISVMENVTIFAYNQHIASHSIGTISKLIMKPNILIIPWKELLDYSGIITITKSLHMLNIILRCLLSLQDWVHIKRSCEYAMMSVLLKQRPPSHFLCNQWGRDTVIDLENQPLVLHCATKQDTFENKYKQIPVPQSSLQMACFHYAKLYIRDWMFHNIKAFKWN